MNEILDKLTSYNIFNHLFPGALFIVIFKELFSFYINFDNLIINLFIYYFIGLVISRIGSLFIEPLLRKIKILKFVEYNDFINVSKIDLKLNLLSEVNNMYRNLCTLFFISIILALYKVIVGNGFWIFLLFIMLFFIFILSYIKQTKKIVNRVISYDKKVDNK